ncbi:MAG: hypothetical protein WD341_08790 [Tistlia sp.]|uniref:hypothetical protein n=1 Tax=Tistlia sp. TaxID=3057121 RepID=UPI0034A0F600
MALHRLRAATGAFLEALRPPAEREPGRLEPTIEQSASLREAAGQTVDADEHDWRKVGQKKRDLAAPTLRRAQELSVYLWRTNPFANWLIEIKLAFLLAEGVTFQADDPKSAVQEWLEDFWFDPINDMETKFVQMARELLLFGELALPAFAAPNGQVRVASIDPSEIDSVMTDPDNATQPVGLSIRRDAFTYKRRYRVIVNGFDEELFSEQTQELRESYTDGDAFYFRINALSTGTRGAPDLMAVADWIDNFDAALWAELERWEQLRAFIWDVTLKGATPEQVEERAQKIFAPAPGSTRVHNDSEEWDAVTPDLKAQDGGGFARLFRNHILGGQGLPEHWFGGGGDVNRATAGEMDEPTLKLMVMKQRALTSLLQTMGRFVVRQRLKASGESYDRDKHGFQVVWPALNTPDAAKMAAAIQAVAQAVMIGIQSGVMSEQTGVQLLSLAAGLFGAEIDPVEELARAREEAKRRSVDSVYGGIAEDPEPPADETARAAE